MTDSPAAPATPIQRLPPLRIVGAYLLVGILWMLLTDRLLGAVAEAEAYPLLDAIKDAFFFVMTSILLYVLIRASERALRRANRAFRVLSNANQAIIRAGDETTLLQAVCRVAVEAGGYRTAWIGFVEQGEPPTVRPVAADGVAAQAIEQLYLTQGKEAFNGVAPDMAVRTGTLRLIQHIPTDPAYAGLREVMQKYGHVSVCAVPLRIEGQVLGVLVVYADEADAFDAQETALLEELAGDLAYGITALRMRRKHEEAERKIRHLASFPQLNPNPVIEIDADGQVMYANAATIEALQAHGLTDVRAFFPPDMGEILAALPVRERQTFSREVELNGNVFAEAISLNAEFNTARIYAIDITARKQAETALRHSESTLSSILRATTAGIGLVVNRVFHWVNDQMCRMTGYTAAELIGQSARMIYPDDAEFDYVGQVKYAQIRETGVGTVETRWQCKDGRIIDVLLSSAALDPTDLSAGVTFTALDITERKQAEKALRQREELLRQVLEMLPVGVWLVDAEGNVAYGNPAGQQIWAGAKYVGIEEYGQYKAWWLSTGERVRPEEWAGARAITRGEASLNEELEIECFDGTRKIMLNSAVPLRDPDGRITGAVVVNEDITARKLAERRLQESEARYRSLFEDSPISLWEEDFSQVRQYLDSLRAAGVDDLRTYFQDHPEAVSHCAALVQVVDVNQATVAMQQAADRSEMLGNLAKLLGPNAIRAFQEELIAFSAGQTHFRTEVSSQTMQGDPLETLVSVSIAPGHTETWAKVFVSIMDITARRRAEEAEREQRALAEALRDSAAALTSVLDFDEVMNRILTNVGRVVPHDAANIMLVEGNRAHVAYWRGYPAKMRSYVEKFSLPLDTPNLWEMFANGTPCVVSDTATFPSWVIMPATAWIRSYAAAPIRSHGQVIGFINLDSATPGFFNAGHAERLQMFADQAAIALENAQFYQALQRHTAVLERLNADLERRNRELLALYEIEHTLTTTLDVREICRVMFREIVQHILAAPYFILALYDATAQLLTCAFAVIDDEEIDPATFPPRPLGEGPNSQAIRARQPLTVDDEVLLSDQNAGAKFMKVGEGPTPRSAVYVPLISGDQVVGVMTLQSYEPNAFSEADVKLLSILAGQAAAALQNAQLFAQVQRHAAELSQRVEERTAELVAILEAMGEGVIYIDQNQVRYVNQAFTNLTGYGIGVLLAESVRSPLAMIVPAENGEQVTQDIIQAWERGEPWQGELKIRRQDGSIFDAGMTMTAVTLSNGQLLGSVALIHDISQRKALQAQRERFIANASHELRTPITNMLLRLALIRRQPEKLEEHLRVMDLVTGRMRRLVDDLLDLSRFERGVITLERQDVVLQSLLTDVIEVQRPEAESKHIRLIGDLPPDPLHAEVDLDRLTQVITNLVVNAINYTPAGGQITVALEARQDAALIRVQDTGVGIAPDMLGKIFEPFFRVEESGVRGTGLGLTIAKEIVELHGGTLSVESEVGRGSVFTITLPLPSFAAPAG